MSIFQSSVVTKHLKTQKNEKIAIQWELFKNHFHNPVIQENIRNSKEEQYQGEFLIDLFVNVLGYTKNPTPNFNITTEYKNVKDSKKADGAIVGKNGQIDHLFSEQIDHQFRSKLTTTFQFKMTTSFGAN